MGQSGLKINQSLSQLSRAMLPLQVMVPLCMSWGPKSTSSPLFHLLPSSCCYDELPGLITSFEESGRLTSTPQRIELFFSNCTPFSPLLLYCLYSLKVITQFLALSCPEKGTAPHYFVLQLLHRPRHSSAPASAPPWTTSSRRSRRASKASLEAKSIHILTAPNAPNPTTKPSPITVTSHLPHSLVAMPSGMWTAVLISGPYPRRSRVSQVSIARLQLRTRVN